MPREQLAAYCAEYEKKIQKLVDTHVKSEGIEQVTPPINIFEREEFQAEVEKSVRAGLRHLTDTQKVIRIDSIAALRGAGGRAQITISFTDLTTGKPDKVSTSG